MYCKKASKAGIVLRYIILILFLLFTIFPLYWIVSYSIRDASEIDKVVISVIPKSFTWQHYIDAISEVGVLFNLRNSLIITLVTIAIVMPTALLSAYAFAKLNFRGKKALYAVILMTQFIPSLSYIVPLYLIYSKLHILNTVYCLWITYLVTTYPMASILLVGYLQDIPDSLEEAALIDGANRMQSMFKITFPLAMPGIVTSTIYSFIGIWQEYFIASSLVQKDSAKTISTAMAKFVTSHYTDWGGLMATSVIAAVPVIILFMCSRKKLADCLSGSVKG